MKRTATAVVLTAVMLSSGCVESSPSDHRGDAEGSTAQEMRSPLRKAITSGQDPDGPRLEDGGRSLILESASVDDAVSALRRLDAPVAVQEHLEQTRVLDGRQVAEWETRAGDFDASWSYDPDQGVDMIVTWDD